MNKKDVLDKLAALAERDLFPALEGAFQHLVSVIPQATAMDVQELMMARALPSSVFQVSQIFDMIQRDGARIIQEVDRLTRQIDQHMAALSKCRATPRRMGTIGAEWRNQADRVGEMIVTAERLADQPDWKGRASEAHLAVIPKQIKAMHDLKGLAETASESVLLVGAIQSNIFDACGLIFTQVIQKVLGQRSQAPTAFFSRSAACVTLLLNMDTLVRQWLSGEGTWSPSATQIADGLSTASPSQGVSWPKAVNNGSGASGSSGSGSGDKSDDKGQKDDDKAQNQGQDKKDENKGQDKKDDPKAGQDPKDEATDADEDAASTAPPVETSGENGEGTEDAGGADDQSTNAGEGDAEGESPDESTEGGLSEDAADQSTEGGSGEDAADQSTEGGSGEDAADDEGEPAVEEATDGDAAEAAQSEVGAQDDPPADGQQQDSEGAPDGAQSQEPPTEGGAADDSDGLSLGGDDTSVDQADPVSDEGADGASGYDAMAGALRGVELPEPDLDVDLSDQVQETPGFGAVRVDDVMRQYFEGQATSETPVDPQPVPDQPVVQDPVAQQPVQDPATQQPVVEQPVAQQPVVEPAAPEVAGPQEPDMWTPEDGPKSAPVDTTFDPGNGGLDPRDLEGTDIGRGEDAWDRLYRDREMIP